MKHRRDVLDEMFDDPELTLRQADRKINGRKRLTRCLLWILFMILIVCAVIWIMK